ncbi:MAG: copper resistance protein NlpE N-terminal domain-containing protein [Marinilabiliaceae bacterium]
MTIKTIFYLIPLFTLSVGCGPHTAGSATTSAPDMHTSRMSIDWSGTYTGTTPCADCPGIETTVTLNEDKTYRWVSHYLEKGDNLFVEKGKFKWNKDGNTLSLTSEDEKERSIGVGENRIFMLDHRGERIRGELANHYTLEKVAFQQLPTAENLLENKRWVLAEILNDSTDRVDSVQERPFIEFDIQRKKISGFGGCNRFFGKYSIQNDSTIRFSEMGATKKHCKDAMETEDHFFDMLGKCRYLKISKTMLIMKDRDQEKMAVFQKQNTETQ